MYHAPGGSRAQLCACVWPQERAMREIPWVYHYLRSKLVYLQVFSQLVLSVSAAASTKRRDSFVRNMAPWREEVPSVSALFYTQ